MINNNITRETICLYLLPPKRYAMDLLTDMFFDEIVPNGRIKLIFVPKYFYGQLFCMNICIFLHVNYH